MKNGLLVYQSANGFFNIGDYIQSLAASQFFENKIDFYINREKLDEFKDDDVKLIMNGWFTSEPSHWPPSSLIHPLFVAFHINSLAKDKILSKEGIRYLKKHEPIGCRDEDTTKMLREKKINAYFSGCLTLTLGKTYSTDNKKDSIYFVDEFSSSKKDIATIFNMIYLFITKWFIIRKIIRKKYNFLSLTTLRKTISFYREYRKHFSDDILLKAEYIKHEVPENTLNSEEEKIEYAKELLKKYAQAKLVITSRIHCALPCLALETPVIFVDNAQQAESSYCRLNGLRELFNLVTSNNGELTFHFKKANTKIDYSTKILNRNDYKSLRDQLNTSCQLFNRKN
ncbi:MAG: polysaccharide pyruvyl transferase family protein [Paludibacter sp.]